MKLHLSMPIWHLTQKLAYKLKSATIEDYKQNVWPDYDSELHSTLSTIKCFVEMYERETGIKLNIAFEQRPPYRSIDED